MRRGPSPWARVRRSRAMRAGPVCCLRPAVRPRNCNAGAGRLTSGSALGSPGSWATPEGHGASAGPAQWIRGSRGEARPVTWSRRIGAMTTTATPRRRWTRPERTACRRSRTIGRERRIIEGDIGEARLREPGDGDSERRPRQAAGRRRDPGEAGRGPRLNGASPGPGIEQPPGQPRGCSADQTPGRGGSIRSLDRRPGRGASAHRGRHRPPRTVVENFRRPALGIVPRRRDRRGSPLVRRWLGARANLDLQATGVAPEAARLNPIAGDVRGAVRLHGLGRRRPTPWCG